MRKWLMPILTLVYIAIVVVLSVIIIGTTISIFRTSYPLWEVVDPLNNDHFDVYFTYQELPESHLAIKYGFAEIVETTLAELTDMTSAHTNLSTIIIITPTRVLPIWGSDVRIDYFTYDINCPSFEDGCGYFHATQNCHWFSSYRIVPSDQYGLEFLELKIDYLDLYFSIIVETLAILSFLGIAVTVIVIILPD